MPFTTQIKPLQLSAKAGENHIYIYDEVASGGWGFSAGDLVAALQDIDKDAPITVHINSIGGDVFEGLAIYNLLRSRQNVTTVTEGLAASIASVIFLAGSVRQIHEHAMLMVHDPSIFAAGKAEDLENMLELLSKAKDQITSIYLSNSTLTEAEINSLLSKDSYITSDEAVNSGFATEIVSVPNVTATANFDSLVAKLFGSKDMKFETWLAAYCKPLGLEPSKLTDEQRTSLKAVFDTEQVAAPPMATPIAAAPLPTAPVPDPLASRRQRDADETDRQDTIRDVSARYASAKLNDDYLTEIGVSTRLLVALL